MIPDRHPLVVWKQRTVRAKHRAHVRGVVNGRIKVGVVANLYGEKQLGVRLRYECVFGDLLVMHWRVVGQQRRNRCAQCDTGHRAAGHQCVERR